MSARIKYGAVVSEIRGSIGGTTFQANKYGHTIKTKPSMIIPARPNQIRTKEVTARVTRHWREMTSAERAQWATYASTFPIAPKHNPSGQLTGYTYFLKYHLHRVLYTSYVSGSFSDFLDSPALTQYDPGTVTISLAESLGDLDVTQSFSTTDVDGRIAAYFSRPLSPGESFVGTLPRAVWHTNCINKTSDMPAEYSQIFGVEPVSGDRVGMRYVIFHEDDGTLIVSSPQILTVS